jgi:hypothetical protein
MHRCINIHRWIHTGYPQLKLFTVVHRRNCYSVNFGLLYKVNCYSRDRQTVLVVSVVIIAGCFRIQLIPWSLALPLQLTIHMKKFLKTLCSNNLLEKAFRKDSNTMKN